MAKNFRDTTDALFSKVGAEDLAQELGCSFQSVKQARMEEGSPGYRSPPPGWEKAAARMARDRAAFFSGLAKRLAQD